MKKQLLSVLLVSLLAACAGKDVKEQPGAAVEERGVGQKQAAVQPSTATKPLQTQPLAANPLTDPGNILSKRSVYYDFDSYVVKDEYKPLIQAHAKYLRENGKATIMLEGNADERGSREYNLALGQRRAESVKKAMEVLGVSEKQVETVSFGEEKPKCAEHDEACWWQNRRSDIHYRGE